MIRQANREIEKTIRDIKESQAEKERTREARNELQGFLGALTRKKEQEKETREQYLEDKLKKLNERQEKERARKARRAGKNAEAAPVEERQEAFRNGPLKVGEKVRIVDNGMVGEVSKVSNKAVTVIIGNISSKLPLDRVERISSNEYRSAVKDSAPAYRPMQVHDAAITERKLNFKPELDVRGERLPDALEKVMRYADDAIMLGMGSVRIVHGKGTGVLHEEIQKMLRTMPGVKSVRDEHIQFGGSGVTIVEFE